MKRKMIRWTVITLSVFVVLFFALGIHLYYVTDNFYQPKGPQLQLARIDFQQPVDSLQGAEIQRCVNNIDGVQKSYFNLHDDILVYSFYAGEQNTEQVYNLLMHSGAYEARRFVVDETQAAAGCPVMGKETSGLLNVYKTIFSVFN